MNRFIPYGRQNITDQDIKAVEEVLRADFLTQGPTIKKFEDAFAKYVGAEFAVAVSNGTAALHIAALALNVKPGDKVLTTSLTFAASANCVKYCGGDVEFVDIDSETYLIDIQKIREKLESNPKGTYQGIIPVDFAGRANDLEALRALANEYDMWIIEDACHAPGGYFTKKNNEISKCGSGEFADLAIFSFHPVKHIAAGEGGMITTNDEKLYKHLLNLRTHGIQQDPSKKTKNDGVWYYEMQELGYNYRLTDIQCALGLSQLNRADEGLIRRREIAKMYSEAFKDCDFVVSQSGAIIGHAYHLYVLEFQRRDELINFLRGINIIAQVHYVPVHLMPYYKGFGWKEGDLPVIEKYYQNCLSIPMFPTLTDDDVHYIIARIKEFYGQ